MPSTAIATVVTVAEILKNNGFAVEKSKIFAPNNLCFYTFSWIPKEKQSIYVYGVCVYILVSPFSIISMFGLYSVYATTNVSSKKLSWYIKKAWLVVTIETDSDRT